MFTVFYKSILHNQIKCKELNSLLITINSFGLLLVYTTRERNNTVMLTQMKTSFAATVSVSSKLLE